jgi:ferrous iron transport protein B
MSDCHGVSAATGLYPPRDSEQPPAQQTVALVGPPNSGKSTLFNRLTGLRQKVANFPGVTVEQHTGRAKVESREVELIDLPGIYSLNPRSEDEQVTHDVLTGELPGVNRPDAILLILDCTNLHRHLVLAAPILRLGLPTLVVLNMADELRARGGFIDATVLSAELGAPVALISAAKGEGVERVFEFLERGAVAMPPAQRLLQLPVLQDVPKCRQWATQVGSRASYQAPEPSLWSRRLDGMFLHAVWGPLIFCVVVIAVFQALFTGAIPFMDAIDWLVAQSGAYIGSILPQGLLRSLIVDGIWSGVGSVIVFLPQILLLTLFIGILEDSGYLARAALIADRTMHRAGLQGKSFIPLLSAYACAVPAIMSTRTIENKRDRIATILIAPFMTCSARFPVYALLIAAFIPDRPVLGNVLTTRPVALLGLYVLGFVAAFLTARVLKSSILKSERNTFVLEMPPYRMPTFSGLALRLLDRAKVFLRRAGTVILAVTVLLWCLASLPMRDGSPPPIEESIVGQVGHAVEPLIEPLGFNWKIGIGLITSLAAREVIIGTLGTIYGMENATHESTDLQAALQKDLAPGGAVALLIFFAFAMQCFSTIAVVRRETGGWKWPAIQFAYMTALAYVSALAANIIVTETLKRV